MADSAAHRMIHPSEWEFRFRSGRLCLDFMATVGDREHLAFDRWRESQDLGRWCVEAGLIRQAGAVRDNQIELARELRETLFRLFTAALSGERPGSADLGRVNKAARKPA